MSKVKAYINLLSLDISKRRKILFLFALNLRLLSRTFSLH